MGELYRGGGGCTIIVVPRMTLLTCSCTGKGVNLTAFILVVHHSPRPLWAPVIAFSKCTTKPCKCCQMNARIDTQCVTE